MKEMMSAVRDVMYFMRDDQQGFVRYALSNPHLVSIHNKVVSPAAAPSVAVVEEKKRVIEDDSHIQSTTSQKGLSNSKLNNCQENIADESVAEDAHTIPVNSTFSEAQRFLINHHSKISQKWCQNPLQISSDMMRDLSYKFGHRLNDTYHIATIQISTLLRMVLQVEVSSDTEKLISQAKTNLHRRPLHIFPQSNVPLSRLKYNYNEVHSKGAFANQMMTVELC